MRKPHASKHNPGVCSIRPFAAALLLVILPLLAYLPAYEASFYSDDAGNVLDNERLRTPEGLREIWVRPGGAHEVYYPVTFTVYWVAYHIWGLQPTGYHVVNVILHAMSACLVWLVLRRLKLPGAWLAGAVFALHPGHVESVAWITETRNTLSTIFYMLTMLAFFGHRPLGSHARSEPIADTAPRRNVLYVASLILFLAALLSKTATLTLPVALILLIWWKEGRLTKRDLVRLLPFFALAAGLSVVTVGIERRMIEQGGPGWEAFSPVDRLLIAGRAVWFYLSKLFVPVDLSFVYPRWTIDDNEAWQYLFPAGVVVLSALLFAIRRRAGPGPLAAFLIFVVTLSPVLSFVDYFYTTYSFVADRFLYLPSVAMIALAVALGAVALRRIGPWASKVAPVLGMGILVTLGSMTWARSACFHDAESLYGDVLRKYPNSWSAHFSLGSYFAARGHPQQAVSHLESAVQLKPDLPSIRGNLAAVYAGLGLYKDAVRILVEALKQKPDDPGLRTNLGFVYAKLGRYEDAVAECKRVLEIDLDFAPARDNLKRVVLFRIDTLLAEHREQDAREFAWNARAAAIGIGATGLVREIDRRVPPEVRPKE
jgi:hypothetical protein